MNNSKLKKSIIVEVSIVRVIVIICQLIFLKVYTHYTSLYELGIYYFLFTISYSLNAFVLVPLDYYQQSQLYRIKNENKSLKSFYSINKIVFKITSIILITTCVVTFSIQRQLWFVPAIIILLALSTYFVNLIRGILNNLERRRQATYTLLFEITNKLIFFFLLIQFFKPSACVILGSMLSASLLSLVLLFVLAIKLPEYRFSERAVFKLREIFHFAYPISIGAVINWIQLQSYSLFLVPLGFVEAVGIFGTLSNIGSTGMNACSTVFAQLYVPNLYNSNGLYIRTYVKNAILLILLVFAGSIFLSGTIVTLATKASLLHYSKIILYGILTEGGNFLIGCLTIYLTIHHLTKSTLKMSIVGLMLFLVTFLFIYLLHIVTPYTLGIPMILTQFVISGGLFLLVNKNLKHA